ncbi:cupin domain-containing protein [Pseudonocardia lacus]|uniref:cupin domain-containing protein n=1 Tax=Pseudonocardia lacus TaxID=2835865 RepID=UPI001BDC92C8|nr:cupin domain-containing protein [Pseudonocardia lacus]
MPVVRHADARRSSTPNATTTTFASPTLGGATVALWQVEMAAGASGPLHWFDVEQVWTVLAGSARIDLDGEPVVVGSGDTVVMPPRLPRQVHADPTTGFTALVTAPGGALASTPGADPVLPPWIA